MCRSVAVVVPCHHVQICAWNRDCASDLMGALRAVGRVGRALWDVVLSGVGADAPLSPAWSVKGRDVVVGNVLLEVHPELHPILQWLILPWHFLVSIKEVPGVVADLEPSFIGANVTGRIPLGQDALPFTATGGEANGIAACQVLDDTAAVAERNRGDGAQASRRRHGPHRDAGSRPRTLR